MRSNQLRLYFSTFAYQLMQGLQRLGPQGTEMAQAQCQRERFGRNSLAVLCAAHSAAERHQTAADLIHDIGSQEGFS